MNKEIYTITTLNFELFKDLIDERIDRIDFKTYRDRCVGFFFNLDDVFDCLNRDCGALNEAGYYDYLVVERMSEGIYPSIGRQDEQKSEWWFKRNYELNIWESCPKPECLFNTIGFGIG